MVQRRVGYLFAVGLVLLVILPVYVEAGTIPDSLRATNGDPDSPPFWVSEEMLQESVVDAGNASSVEQYFAQLRFTFLSDHLDRFPLVSDSQIERGTLDDCEPFEYMLGQHSASNSAELRSRSKFIASVEAIGAKPDQGATSSTGRF